MQSKALSPDEYVASLPDERREAIQSLRDTILSSIPEGFEEVMGYGMIGYIVPHRLYPVGYHCNPQLPLPFVSLASQKNYISIYHMGLYSDGPLLDWFLEEWPKHTKAKLDMGKSCIRFKKISEIPLPLIAEMMQKITPAEWIEIYEKQLVSRV